MSTARMTSSRRETRVAAGAVTLGFLLVAAQRFGINFGADSLQSTTLILVLTVMWALIYARAPLMAISVVLYAALIVTTSISTVIGSSFGNPSIAGLILLVVTYVVTLVSKGSTGLGPRFFDGAMWAVKVGALLALMQYSAQVVGLGYIDPVKSLPPAILVSGFNSYYSLEFAGGYAGQFKPNGIIFLEPSFLSLFTAIAIVYTFWRLFTSTEGRRSEVLWLVVLAGGFAVSASASGVVVILLASVAMAITVRRRRALLLTIIGILLIALAVGWFDAVINKANEGFGGVSSASLRLVLPYQVLTPYWLEHPLMGWGAGMSSTIIGSFNYGGLQASTLMKLLVEYGVASAVIVGTIVVRALWWAKAPLAIVVAVVAAWAIPGEALVNPVLVGLLLFALPHWSPRIIRPHLY